MLQRQKYDEFSFKYMCQYDRILTRNVGQLPLKYTIIKDKSCFLTLRENPMSLCQYWIQHLESQTFSKE